MFQGSFKGVFKEVSRVFQGCFKGVSRNYWFLCFFTNIFVGKIHMFGGGLVNIFVMLTLRVSVSVSVGVIFSDVSFPINK